MLDHLCVLRMIGKCYVCCCRRFYSPIRILCISCVYFLSFFFKFLSPTCFFIFLSFVFIFSIHPSFPLFFSFPFLLRSRFRTRYRGEYEGMSTKDLGGDLRRDVEHYRGLWRTARQADTKVCAIDHMKKQAPYCLCVRHGVGLSHTCDTSVGLAVT